MTCPLCAERYRLLSALVWHLAEDHTRQLDRLGVRAGIITDAVRLAVHPPRPHIRRGHGTHAGHNRHVKADEEVCDLCRAGERAYQRSRDRGGRCVDCGGRARGTRCMGCYAASRRVERAA